MGFGGHELTPALDEAGCCGQEGRLAGNWLDSGGNGEENIADISGPSSSFRDCAGQGVKHL